MTEEEKYKDNKTEQEELDRLIARGVHFSIEYTEKKRVYRSIKSLFVPKYEVTNKKEDYMIKEPTLAVLDHLSRYWIGINIDSDSLNKGGVDTLTEAKRLVNEQAKNMAFVVAIAVLGENYYYTKVDKLGRVNYCTDDKALNELADKFLHSIKPSDLLNLTNIIIGCCNLVNFTSSMHLMKASKTTTSQRGIE